MENTEVSGQLPVPRSSFLRTIHHFYYSTLDRVEWWMVALLLAAVIVLSLIEILARNLGWHPWDMGANQRAVYGFTFYLGVFGAVLASRQGKHIAIDVASHYLSPQLKQRIGIVLALVGAFACAGLAYSAHIFVMEVISPDQYLVPSQIPDAEDPAWYAVLWKDRTWRWPMVPAFGLMSLHFLVGAAERVAHLNTETAEGGA